MSNLVERKACPLLLVIGTNRVTNTPGVELVNCQAEKCAWWIENEEKGGKCAVTAIAHSIILAACAIDNTAETIDNTAENGLIVFNREG